MKFSMPWRRDSVLSLRTWQRAALLAVSLLAAGAHAQTAAINTDPTALDINEGASATYTVVLATQPSADVTVTVTSTNTDVTVDTNTASGVQTTLTFTSTDWNTAQTVTASVAEDVGSADETATLTHTGAAGGYAGVTRTLSVTVQDDEQTGTDYDTDEDRLIEISSLAQLNAIRYDLNGDGAVAVGDTTNYGNAFTNAATGMGCPDGSDAGDVPDACLGYELAQDLNFDTDGDGDVDGDDPNSYTNWNRIGPENADYSAIFDGNHHTISNLIISGGGNTGLFTRVNGTIRNLGLKDVSVSVNAGLAGALAFWNRGGTISAVWVSGTVSATGTTANKAAGLVNRNTGRIVASFSAANVSSVDTEAGGLVSNNQGGTIIASYATGSVSGQGSGGLVGFNDTATVRSSYSTGRVTGTNSRGFLTDDSGTTTNNYWDTVTSGTTSSHGATGRTTAQLQMPTSATGDYANWDDLDLANDGSADEDPWDFGTEWQYPVLSYAGMDTAFQFDMQPPTFAGATVEDQKVRLGDAMSLQIPAARHSSGALTYSATGLPSGTVFDADGSGDCGTARTICGTPTAAGTSTVAVSAAKADGTAVSLGFDIAVYGIAISSTSPAPLREVNLHGTTVTVTLTETAFAAGVTASSFTLTSGVPGLSIGSVATVSDGDTTATLTLDYDGTNFDVVDSLSVNLVAAAHDEAGSLTSAPVEIAPTRGVTLPATTLAVREDSSATYAVRLASAPDGGDVTVTITGAADGISVDRTSLVFTASNYATGQVVRVSAADDANIVHETVTLTHTPSGADYGSVTAAQLQVTATDDDTASLRVSPTRLTVGEDESATYTVRLNAQPTATVTVTVGGTTTDVTVDTDATTPNNQTTLTFDSNNWGADQTVTVSAADDSNAMDETVNLTHAATGGNYAGLALSARPGVMVTVTDDDMPAILIDADPSTANMDEPGPLALNEMMGHADNSKGYTVRLSTLPTAEVRVTVTSGDGAVTVDTDTTPRTRTLTFTTMNWATAQTVTATAAEDDDTIDDEVTIEHLASRGGYTGISAALVATIVDDDEPAIVVDATALTGSGAAEGGMATYTVRLGTEPASVVQVSVSATGPVAVDMDGEQAGLQSRLRFDAMNWNTGRTIVVRGNEDDDAAVGMATLRHTASGADYGDAPPVETMFSVTDNDTPTVTVSPTTVAVNEGSTITYSVVLGVAPTGGDVTVAVTSSDTAAATVSPAALTFTASNWNAPQQVTVSGVEDNDSTDGSATISNMVSGADYPSVTAQVSVTVRDDEAAGVRIEPPQLSIREGERGTYRVRLNTQPSGNVTVTPTAAPGSEDLATDGDGTAMTFTPQNWNTEQTQTRLAAHDDDAMDDALSVLHLPNGYTGVTSAPSLPVLVEDDDAPGIEFDPPGGVSVVEGGSETTATYTVVLTALPSAAVTVTVSSDDAGLAFDTNGGMMGDQSSLTFSTMNWATAQTVTVRAVADGDAASETVTLLHSATGGGYAGTMAAYQMRMSDADAAPAPTRVVATSAGATSLTVRWQAAAGAQGYLVQWRLPTEAWSEERQQEVAAGTTQVRIDGLRTGARYEVRVLGLNRGDSGDPSLVASASPSTSQVGGSGGRGAPQVANVPGAVVLEAGGEATIDLSNAFTDPDGDALTYTAFTSDNAVVSARIEDNALLLGAGRAGSAEVTLIATDPGGLSASATITVDVIGTSCTTDLAQAAEGGTATAMAELTSPARAPTTVRWRIVADADPATADADAGDHGDASGEVVVAVGERCAEIEIDILDDEDAEPAREWFAVELQLRFAGSASLAKRLVPVAVREGVCDRTPTVAEALLTATRSQRCDEPAATNLAGVQTLRLAGAGLRSLTAGDLGDLAGLRTLDLSDNALNGLPSLSSLPRLERLLLSGNTLAEVPRNLPSPERLLDLNLSANALSELPSDAFDGLSALRVLRLDGNELTALPDGVFAGLSSLRLLRLDDNPGTPFLLPVEVERTDADPWAPSPARLRVATPLGAPFDMTVGLSAEGGVFADGTTGAETVVPAGELAGPLLSLSSATGFAQVSPTPPSLPSRLCLGQPCWRGFEFAMESLTLFVRPLQVLSAPEPAPLFGDALRVPLASLVAPGDATASGELTWSASSSDESVAEVRIVDGALVIEAIAGAEGTVVVGATATDALGQTATVRFEVQVDFHWRTSPTRGWRGAIPPD